jgi:hypothetical protein
VGEVEALFARFEKSATDFRFPFAGMEMHVLLWHDLRSCLCTRRGDMPGVEKELQAYPKPETQHARDTAFSLCS